MNNKLNCIMLVDDNEADNYLHSMVIEEADCTNQIVVMLTTSINPDDFSQAQKKKS